MSKEMICVLKLAMISSLIGSTILVFVWLNGATEQVGGMSFRSIATTVTSIFALFLSIWLVVGIIVGFAHTFSNQRKPRKKKYQ